MLYTQLRAFHAVAEQGSFTRAAERLQVSQPTVSEQVRRLEAHYRVRLFERRARRIELTDTGRRLQGATARLMRSEVEAEQILSTARELAYGRLRVGADSPYLIVPLLGEFKRRHPGLQISLSLGNSRMLMEDLLARRVDVVVVPDIERDPRLHAVALRQDRLVAIVPHGHAFGSRREIGLQELASETLVLRESGSTTRAVFEGAVTDAKVVLREVMEIGSREAVREAVAAGLGIGVVAESELGTDPRLTALPISAAGLQVVEFAACVAERQRVRVVAAFFRLLDVS